MCCIGLNTVCSVLYSSSYSMQCVYNIQQSMRYLSQHSIKYAMYCRVLYIISICMQCIAYSIEYWIAYCSNQNMQYSLQCIAQQYTTQHSNNKTLFYPSGKTFKIFNRQFTIYTKIKTEWSRCATRWVQRTRLHCVNRKNAVKFLFATSTFYSMAPRRIQKKMQLIFLFSVQYFHCLLNGAASFILNVPHI